MEITTTSYINTCSFDCLCGSEVNENCTCCIEITTTINMTTLELDHNFVNNSTLKSSTPFSNQEHFHHLTSITNDNTTTTTTDSTIHNNYRSAPPSTMCLTESLCDNEDMTP